MKNKPPLKAMIVCDLGDPSAKNEYLAMLDVSRLAADLSYLDNEMRSLVKYNSIPEDMEFTHKELTVRPKPIDFYKEITAHWRKRLNEILGDR